ncbi:MAG: hypothetical protein CME71_04270 [Halobacteriovorax sp.]|nr:hypothetical protein [Halobacteriovorax sp.]
MKILIATLFIFFATLPAWAQSGSSKGYFKLDPIVGYERVQKLEPTPHMKSRLIYGLRANYGPPIFSAEAEITQGKDDEAFPTQDLVIEEKVTNAMLGLRSSFNFGGMLSWFLRAGGHARKSEYTRTQSGVTTVREPAIYVSPYAGTGASFNLMGNFTANAGYTVIFTGKPKGSDREYQTTLGFAIKI